MATTQPYIIVEDGDSGTANVAPPASIVDLTEHDESTPENGESASETSDNAWESDYFDDLLEQEGKYKGSSSSPDRCTPQQAEYLTELLRTVGFDQFVMRTIERGMSVRKLCTAFYNGPLEFLIQLPEDACYQLLGKLMNREMSRRRKLTQYNTLDDAVELLKSRENIMIITGAGISTSLGIPDFRSKNTGFYAQLAPLGLSEPEEVFNLEIFQQDPQLFYSVAKGILPSTQKYSPTHAFIRLVQDKGKLLTNYTQNIDNLEEAAGVLPEKLIQCHGSFATATCQKCGYNVRGDEIVDDIRACHVPRCVACVRSLQQMRPAGMKRKRSSNGLSSKKKREDYEDSSDEEDYQIDEPGVMKPDITFFGEPLSAKFHDRIKRNDKDLVDLVIVIGTKLSVAPVGDIPAVLPANVPQIFISREPCTHIEFDIELLGDCDIVVAELCRRAGWNLEHEMNANSHRPALVTGVDQNPAQTSIMPGTDEDLPIVGTTKAVKPANPTVGSAFGAATQAAVRSGPQDIS